ncbi:MAG: FAD-dependent oxidoreductase, partial [Pseudomonadota bacterium]
LLDDIATVPCGAYEKVAIALSEPLVDDPAKRFAKIDPGAPERLIDFQIVPGPQPMMIAHLGGSRAREMVREGPEARMALARERLGQAFGAQAEAAILGMATTDWLTDPLVRGAYSASLPGEGRRRHAMIAAETGPIAFAGEAFSRQWQATAHGAYQSGRDVAARVAGALR